MGNAKQVFLSLHDAKDSYLHVIKDKDKTYYVLHSSNANQRAGGQILKEGMTEQEAKKFAQKMAKGDTIISDGMMGDAKKDADVWRGMMAQKFVVYGTKGNVSNEMIGAFASEKEAILAAKKVKNGKVVNRISNQTVYDGEVVGWIAFYNRKKLEIKKGTDAHDLGSAKQFAINHFKVPKSKQGLLAIEPAY